MQRDMQPTHWCSGPSFGGATVAVAAGPRVLKGSGGKNDREQTEGAPLPTSHRPRVIALLVLLYKFKTFERKKDLTKAIFLSLQKHSKALILRIVLCFSNNIMFIKTAFI